MNCTQQEALERYTSYEMSEWAAEWTLRAEEEEQRQRAQAQAAAMRR